MKVYHGSYTKINKIDLSKSENYRDFGYDIVEGPVADDRIQRRLADFLEGKISRKRFLDELSYKEPSHQICFCTARALLMLKNTVKAGIDDCIGDIGEPLVEALMLDFNFSEKKATDLFFNSKTFAQLSDENTELYKSPWQQIYEMLKKELQM
jgi:hypothetical protein